MGGKSQGREGCSMGLGKGRGVLEVGNIPIPGCVRLGGAGLSAIWRTWGRIRDRAVVNCRNRGR